MAYDHEEQEQLASLKSWWRQYGNLLTWVLVAVLLAYSAWSGWNLWQRNQAAQAAVLYDEAQKAGAARDNAKLQRVSADLQDKYGRTAYAQMASLLAARGAWDANDPATAKKQLQWVVESGHDEEFKVLARIRLAGVLADEKKFDEAMKLLTAEVPAQFASAMADRRGDVLVAQQKKDEARAAYKLALEKSDPRNPAKELIQLKLDALGGNNAG
jgi:predicted negative regulator of RcsB-dependent stress response